MAELSRDEVIDVIGHPLSDVVVAQIIATRVTKEELAAARDRALRDKKSHDPGGPLTPGHFAAAVELLERLHGQGIIGQGGSTLQ